MHHCQARALENVHPTAAICVQIDTRISSGMEPASAKRQHLSPAQLQERLSHLFGRPLKAQEMSRLIPNFPELLEDPDATPGGYPRTGACTSVLRVHIVEQTGI